MDYSYIVSATVARRRAMDAIKAFGAKELDVVSHYSHIEELTRLGYSLYYESFNEDDTWCMPIGDNTDDGFKLSGSKMSILVLAYDPKRWCVYEEAQS